MLRNELQELTYRIATTPHDVGVTDPKARIREIRERLDALDAESTGGRGGQPGPPARGRLREDLSTYGDPVPDPARTYDVSSQPYAGGRSERSERPDRELTRGRHDHEGRFGQYRRGSGRN
ncbi:hypothetical protein [Streptomyces sp. NPDC096339]|uniref:hypothetical protein n=1 Tax=Streptomyces sp. NPDC096339 TaxID=3366086 RepID=UPI003809D9A7